MDPFLELHWLDLHADLVTLARTSLNKSLPADLVARMEERVVIDSIDYATPKVIYPDVRVYEDPSQPNTAAVGALTVAEPIVLKFEKEEHVETYVTITTADGGQLVTVLEFLSPANKVAGDGRDQYRQKRLQLAGARVNVVEIDLVRAGSWRDLLAPTVAPNRIQSAYRVITWRIHPEQRVELYPISLKKPLPVIPVPLRASDRDVPLDLQSLLNQAYENGRYDRTRYDRQLDAGFDADDQNWIDQLLRTAGKR
jgi:hypothetical protein